jgi:hypothetical protein
VNFDLYVWQSPRELDAGGAEALIDRWEAAGGDPGQSPFEASTDMGWFNRELMQDLPDLDVSSDAVPNPSRTPVWLSGTDEPPARVVAVRLDPAMAADAVNDIFSLAMKYDLVLFDARNRRVHLPLEEMSAYASATFWPRGAIQAAAAGGAGGIIAVVAWLLGIPLVSGLVALAGGFMFVMAIYSFLHEGRKAMTDRRGGGERPPGG